MEEEIQKLLDAFTDLRKKASANTVFGKPVTTKERTVIPVAEIAYGFEMGIEGEAEEEAGGGSGSMSARPLAIIEVMPEGARVKPIIDEQKLALAGALLIGWAIFWLARTLGKIFGQQE